LIASDVLKNEKGCAVDACSALSHADMPLQMYFCWNFGKAIIKPVNRVMRCQSCFIIPVKSVPPFCQMPVTSHPSLSQNGSKASFSVRLSMLLPIEIESGHYQDLLHGTCELRVSAAEANNFHITLGVVVIIKQPDSRTTAMFPGGMFGLVILPPRYTYAEDHWAGLVRAGGILVALRTPQKQSSNLSFRQALGLPIFLLVLVLCSHALHAEWQHHHRPPSPLS
jgi:hypothetical protein